MSLSEKIEMLTVLLDISDKSMDYKLSVYLDFAEREIIAWLYSLVGVPENPTLPSYLDMTHVQAVVAGFNLSGAENQTSHSENGINRVFRYSDMLEYIHSNVIAYAKV